MKIELYVTSIKIGDDGTIPETIPAEETSASIELKGLREDPTSFTYRAATITVPVAYARKLKIGAKFVLAEAKG